MVEANGVQLLSKGKGSAVKFSEKNTAALELPAGRADGVWWDDDVGGLGIRIRAGGSRTWLFRYRIGKKQRAIKLGAAGTVPLVLARKNAKILAARVANGEDPALDRELARSEAENTFGVLAEQFPTRWQRYGSVCPVSRSCRASSSCGSCYRISITSRSSEMSVFLPPYWR